MGSSNTLLHEYSCFCTVFFFLLSYDCLGLRRLQLDTFHFTCIVSVCLWHRFYRSPVTNKTPCRKIIPVAVRRWVEDLILLLNAYTVMPLIQRGWTTVMHTLSPRSGIISQPKQTRRRAEKHSESSLSNQWLGTFWDVQRLRCFTRI